MIILKRGIRVVAFLTLLSVVLFHLYQVFGIAAEGSTLAYVKHYNELYKKTEDKWDGVFIGASVVDHAWVAVNAWHDFGMTIFPMNTATQPIYMTNYILEEVKKYKDIKLAIVDIRGIRDSGLKPKEVSIRKVVDVLKPSFNRMEAVKEAMDFYKKYYQQEGKENPKEIKKLNETAYYLSIMKYHSRWQEGLTKDDFDKPDDTLKGYYDVSDSQFKTKKVKKTAVVTKSVELTELQKEILDKMNRYGKENKIKILYVVSPSFMTEKEQLEINAATNYLEETGSAVINFNTDALYEQVGIDFEQDFRDAHHMNTKGGIKFTKYLAKYINENYELEDKRGDKSYESWDRSYDGFWEYYEKGWAQKETEAAERAEKRKK